MLDLTESAGVLTIAYPLWLGLLVAGMGVAILVYLFRGKAPAGKRFGAGAAGLVCLIGAGHFLGYKAVFDGTFARLSSPTASARIAWPEVARVAVEQRPSGRGGPSPYLVLYPRSGPELAIGVSGISPGELQRVMEFIDGKQKENRAGS